MNFLYRDIFLHVSYYTMKIIIVNKFHCENYFYEKLTVFTSYIALRFVHFVYYAILLY